MGKITLMIHPFFYLKPDMFKPWQHQEKSLNERKVFRSLENFENYREDNKVIRDKAKRRLRMFKRSVDFAKEGVLVIFRADPDQGYTEVEKLLFDYTISQIPEQNLYFDPPINERRHSLSKEYMDFLVNRFGSIGALKDLQLYTFGESLDACVAQETLRTCKRGKFSRHAIVLAKYCIPYVKSLAEANKIMDDYFKWNHEFNPKRLEVHWSK